MVFGIDHDTAGFSQRTADPQDGHTVNEPRFAGIVTDPNYGFSFYEILPLLVKPLQ